MQASRTLVYPLCALFLLVVHMALARWSGAPENFVQQLLVMAVQGLALLATLVRARRSASLTARRLWRLLGLAVLMQLLWSAVNAVSALGGDAAVLGVLGLLCSALYIIPCMFLIASSFGPGEPRVTVLVDLLLSVLMAALLALLISRVMDGTEIGGVPGITIMIWHADAIDFSLAILATLRLFGAGSMSRRHFYFAAAGFLWVNAAIASLYNRVELDGLPWWGRVLIDVPFVLLAFLAVRAPPRWVRRLAPSFRFSQVVAAFAPIAMSLGVLLLGISVTRISFLPGAAAAATAAVLYGLRVAFVQTRHLDANRRIDLSNRALQLQLGRDALTGIANRTVLDARLRDMPRGGTCSLLMIDIDYFKQFNDSQGHVAGDACLVRVAQTLDTSLVRAADLVARYGGEEFAVVLPDTQGDAAAEVARRLLDAIRALGIPHPAGPLGVVTVSIGIATQVVGDGAGAAVTLLQEADRALYRAKGNGRNRFEVASGEDSSLILQPQPQPQPQH